MKKLVALVIVCVAIFAIFFPSTDLQKSEPTFSADLEKGLDALTEGDYETALRELHPLAQQGDSEAQFFLGLMYNDKTTDFPKDYKKGIKWLTLSAEQGFVDAQYFLGAFYTEGEFVQKDYSEAAKWFWLAAEQGHAWSQYNLGVIYESGKGVPQDNVRAHMWLNFAASNNPTIKTQSAKLRDAIQKLMTSSQLEKAQGLAQECLAKNYKSC